MEIEKLQHNKSGLYLCLFSDGTLKVGRASNVKGRLKTIESVGECFEIFVVKKAHIPCNNHVKAEKRLIDWCISVCSKQSCREWFKGVNYDECLKIARSIASEHMEDVEKIKLDGIHKMLDKLSPRTLTDEIYFAGKEKLKHSILSKKEIITALDFLHFHCEKIRSVIGIGITPPEWFLDLNCENPWEIQLLICVDYPDDFPSLARNCADAIEEIQKLPA